MDKKKLDVADLQLGMYVAELDIPWLESDFLYQGFVIDNQEQIDQIRKQCAYVYIDIDRGEDVAPQTRTGQAPEPDRDVDEAGFQRELQRAATTRERGSRVIAQVLEDVRLGESLNTEEAREVVSELAETVSNNTNASMWLTNLQRKHERSAVHSMNVCVLALTFARYLGYERGDLEAIGVGALLHDVGLMKVPPEILDKTGPLTAEEFDIVKRHPMEGYQVLRLMRDFPSKALDIVRHHHERVSGSGYPAGISGEDIPKTALIVAIADVYDSLTSDSPYSTAVPPHEALGVLRTIAASDFGDELVEEFIRCVGIYPVGSLVRLVNGMLAVVVSHTRLTRLRPVIMMLKNADGSPYPNRPHINLDSLPEDSDKSQWMIQSIVDPRKHGIDMAQIAADQVGGPLRE